MIITEQLIETLTSTDINFSLNQIIKSPSQSSSSVVTLLLLENCRKENSEKSSSYTTTCIKISIYTQPRMQPIFGIYKSSFTTFH